MTDKHLLWNVVEYHFLLTDGRPPHKGGTPRSMLCNNQPPKTQYYTNVNQMWLFYGSSKTTGLLFSGNDLVNGAFTGVSAPKKVFKIGQEQIVT